MMETSKVLVEFTVVPLSYVYVAKMLIWYEII